MSGKVLSNKATSLIKETIWLTCPCRIHTTSNLGSTWRLRAGLSVLLLSCHWVLFFHSQWILAHLKYSNYFTKLPNYWLKWNIKKSQRCQEKEKNKQKPANSHFLHWEANLCSKLEIGKVCMWSKSGPVFFFLN